MYCTKHILGFKHICIGLNETYWAHAQQGAENTDDEIDQYETEDDDVPPALTAPLHKGLLDQYHQLYEIILRMEARMDFDQARIDYCLRHLDAWFDRAARKLDIDHPTNLEDDS